MSKPVEESPLTKALRHFETAEANLTKLERVWAKLESLMPEGICFGSDPSYEESLRRYCSILPQLPSIDGWKPSSTPLELNEIAQMRLDATEFGEMSAIVSVDDSVSATGAELREYRFRLNQKRRELVRDVLLSLIDLVDADIRNLRNRRPEKAQEELWAPQELWAPLKDHVGQIDALLGSASRPPRWSDLRRHISSAQQSDLNDIQELDWPIIKKTLTQDMYDENEPIPSEIGDLSELINKRPSGSVTSQLKWETLSEIQFERLIFRLISSADSYENPQWLTQTNAPDRGRDLSVERIIRDPLAGVSRLRVIIQCKHWLTRSVNVGDVALLQKQMKLWEPPRVDVHIIATSGRFTSDAVELIEKDNQSDRALKVEMWPESHLEMLLASRPALIGEFSLR
jgi:Restriction endonuclease